MILTHKNEPAWEVDSGPPPRDCFPVNFNRDNLIRVTRIGDLWNRYVNANTGEEIDCAEFARQMAQEVK